MRFMILIKGDEQSEAGTMPSDELVSAMMRYNQSLVDAGALLAAEGLRETARGARVKFHGGKPTVVDGPFAEAKEVIAGYWIIQAKTLTEAIEWAKRIPFEAAESSYPQGGAGEAEIRQIFELEEFPVNENESGWREAEAAQRAETPTTPQAQPGFKRFVVFRMADRLTESGAMPSEEILAAMGAYNEDGFKAGVFLTGEGLHPSSDGARIRYSRGKRTVTDGPFLESKELVAGFSLMQAKSLRDALEWVKRWPPLDAGGEFELQVREVFDTEDFKAELSPELRAAEERLQAQLAGKRKS